MMQLLIADAKCWIWPRDSMLSHFFAIFRWPCLSSPATIPSKSIPAAAPFPIEKSKASTF
jgi:hypothetical protein